MIEKVQLGSALAMSIENTSSDIPFFEIKRIVLTISRMPSSGYQEKQIKNLIA